MAHNHSHNHDDHHEDHHEHDHAHHHHGHSHGDLIGGKNSCSKSLRLAVMLTLIFVFFIVEIIVGHITHSLTLIADSFHMLSDFIALCIALFSVWISKKQSAINTFGWVRAEILGALINSVFLLSICLSIVIEAVERFLHEHEIDRVNLMIYVACGGLAINIFGLFIFGHGHGHVHVPDTIDELESMDNIDDNNDMDTVIVNPNVASKELNSEDIEASKCLVKQNKIIGNQRNSKNKKNKCCDIFKMKHIDLNIKAVFLHVLADALGSVVVIISGLINKYHYILKLDKSYTRYVDPVLSLVLVLLILASTIPLLKESAFILLQSVPKNIALDKLKSDLKNINCIIEIEKLHIWKLSDRLTVASAHIKFKNVDEYLRNYSKVKNIFTLHHIFETTIEPSFVEDKHEDDVMNGEIKRGLTVSDQI